MKVVFDTAGFLAGLQNLFDKVYTTPLVIEEVKDFRSQTLLKMSIEAGKVIEVNPSTESINYVRKILDQIGEKSLSNTDISIIALAYELKPSIVFTDDLAVQNVLLHLGIGFNSVKLGIKMKIRKTIIYKCSACGRTFTKKYNKCPYCGNEITEIKLKS